MAPILFLPDMVFSYLMMHLLLCSGGEASATTKSGVLSAPFINSVKVSGILTILILSSLNLSFFSENCGNIAF